MRCALLGVKKAAEPGLFERLFAFDELVAADLSVLMSHANPDPRERLCGTSPIQMFLAAYAREGRGFLDALGIEQIDRDDLRLTPEIPGIERERRGEEPPTKLK